MPKIRKSYSKKRRTRKQAKKRVTRKQHTRRHRKMRGGRTDEPTIGTVEGFPITEETIVSIPGKGTYSMKAFKQHEIDMDFQGEEQEQ